VADQDTRNDRGLRAEAGGGKTVGAAAVAGGRAAMSGALAAAELELLRVRTWVDLLLGELDQQAKRDGKALARQILSGELTNMRAIGVEARRLINRPARQAAQRRQLSYEADLREQLEPLAAESARLLAAGEIDALSATLMAEGSDIGRRGR
jgi:hypothetical protein